MSAMTDELRRMLDERGVAYRWYNGTATWYADGVMYNAWGYDSERLTMSVCRLTPAQAIDATLGRGTCRAANASEYAWDDFECSECGWVTWGFIMEHEGCGTVAQPKFCPNCGRKVVDA